MAKKESPARPKMKLYGPGWTHPAGYVEAANGSWLLQFDADGHAVFSPKRRADGAVVGRSMATRKGLLRDWRRRANR